MKRSVESLATLGLLCVTIMWGSTFYMIKEIMLEIDAISFLAIRFLMAGLVMGIIYLPRLLRLEAYAWKISGTLGLVYALGQLFQTIGLKYTPASVSGFITGMYVVITPFLVWLLCRQKINKIIAFSCLLAITGMAILSLRGLHFGYGELLTIVGAFFYALHIVLISKWATKVEIIALTTLQMIFIALTCLLASVPGGLAIPTTISAWGYIVYSAFAAGLLAMFIQTWAQKHLEASKAAIIMSMEPVFATVFAVIFAGELLNGRIIVGGLLILSAMLLTELAEPLLKYLKK